MGRARQFCSWQPFYYKMWCATPPGQSEGGWLSNVPATQNDIPTYSTYITSKQTITTEIHKTQQIVKREAHWNRCKQTCPKKHDSTAFHNKQRGLCHTSQSIVVPAINNAVMNSRKVLKVLHSLIAPATPNTPAVKAQDLKMHQISEASSKSDPPTSAKTSKSTNSARLPQNWQLKIAAVLFSAILILCMQSILSYSKLSDFCHLLYSQLLCCQLLYSELLTVSYSHFQLLYSLCGGTKFIGGFPAKLPQRRICACMSQMSWHVK